MDPISIIVTALVLGAAAGTESVAEQAVKDAYVGLKALLQRKFARVNVTLVEDDPTSLPRQIVLQEDLVKANADHDPEVIEAARVLLDTIRDQVPEVARIVGVNLEDIEAGSLILRDIIASGTGINVQRAKFAGDVKIEGVRAGMDLSHEERSAETKSSSSVSLHDVNARDVFIQVSKSIHDPTLPARRRRIALIKWLQLTADQLDQYVHELWRLGFAKTNLFAEEMVQLHRLQEKKIEIVRFYTRLNHEVPTLFMETMPSRGQQNLFSEVFPAFKREMEACLDGIETVERGLDVGISVPVVGDGNYRVSSNDLFAAKEIWEHLRIVKLAVGSIIDLFPVDEVEDTRDSSA